MHFRPNAALAALLLLTISCSLNKNSVRLKSSNFTDEIDLQQNLVFTFDRNLVPDSLTGKWDSSAYLAFTPAVKGLFKWNNPKELVFSPSLAFQGSTVYQAVFTDLLLRHADKNLNDDELIPIHFHTPYLKLTGSEASWVRSKKVPGLPALQVTLLFNYRVDPDEIRHLTSLRVNGKEMPFEIMSTSPSAEVLLLCDGLEKNPESQTSLDIRVAAGLHCMESNYQTSAMGSFQQSLSSPEKLAITQVQGLFEGTEAVLEISTNQPVEGDDIGSLVKITPAVEFSLENRESGLALRGNFTSGASYEVNISKKLRGALGGEMAGDYIALVPFGQLEPSISFASGKGVYLSSRGSKTVGVQIVNIPKVKLTVTRIYENNIQAFLRNNRYREYMGEGEDRPFTYEDYNLDEVGDVVMKQEYETKNLALVNGSRLLNLDFTEQGAFRGIYLVRVESGEDKWRKAVKLVSISDIGLMVKQTEDEIYVFANSILNMQPLADIRVNFTSANNQTLYTGTTNKDGVAVFSGIRSKFPGFRVSMITARSGNDFNYLVFRDSRVENSRFDVGGARNNESGYQAFIYGDREIYRPGETVHNNTIIRNEGRENVRDVAVKLRYLLPNGKELRNLRRNLDRQGSCESSLELASGTVTGTYTLEVYTSNDLLIGSRNFSVEEFIPDRINVVLNTNLQAYSLSDSVRADIRAVNLFGPPAADRNYEAEFSFTRKYFYSKNFPSYNFGIKGSDKLVLPVTVRQGKTNAEGKALEQFLVDPVFADEGLLNGKIFVTVFDESGRPVNRIRQFDIKTQDVFYGIRIPDYYVGTNQPVEVGLIATDATGNAVDRATVHVQVIRVKWHTVMERTYDTHYRYVSQREEEIITDRRFTIARTGSVFPFIPNESGEYLVRVRRPGSGKYVESEFYAYRWGSTSNTSFQVNNEGQVEISTDKETYEPGERASLLFKTPFAGKLLVTIERNKVFEYHYLTTDKKAAMLLIPLKEEYLPNVYVSATLFKPLDDGSMPLTVAHGFASISLAKKSNRLPVTIIAAARSRSRTRQTVTVKTLPKSDIEVTVAVVDEGIMQLKNSPTPDPYHFFYQKQALTVESFDVYPWLLPDLKMKRSSTGGDGYDLQKRVNPLSNKRVNLVAYWSGILKTNASGEATCTVDIPQFSGDLRVMAVVYKDQTFGSAEKHIQVADPVVISAGIPRFLSPGDTLLMPVTITNTLPVKTSLTARISLTGPVTLSGINEQQLEVEAHAEKRTTWKVIARQDFGEGSIEVQVKAAGSSYSDLTAITVRPPASLQKASDAGSISGGAEKTLNLTTGFIPASVEGKLFLSRSPMVRFSDQLEYLLDYPYGCVEQITSMAFPQLYFADLAKSLLNKPGRPVNITRNVQAAISRIQSMQLYNGGLSYWPGGDEESWWGSAYACHFLTEAKRAGYEVSQPGLEKLISYLAAKSKTRDEIHYFFYHANGKRLPKKFAARELFYSLYVLALNGRPDLSTMNYYKYKTNSITLDARYLLATTFLICGDRKGYADLLPTAFEGEQAVRETGGSFSSYIRDEALALSGLLEADPDNPQTGVMVNHLSSQIRKEKYLSTQERAFAFLALGKFMKRNRENRVMATIQANGVTVGEFNGEDLILSKNIFGQPVTVTVKGSGTLYYSWDMEGLTRDGSFPAEDNFLRIRKTFLNRFGQPLKSNSISQNDLVVVKLVLENTERSHIRNVVITDMLPAGFEIENPRIGAVAGMNWVRDQAQPDYMDIRDDRINLFTSADLTPKVFYYLARAVSTGTFVMGPVSADAMYDGEYHSYHGSGVVRVTGK